MCFIWIASVATLVLVCRILAWIIALMNTLMSYFFITTSVQSLFQARNSQVKCWVTVKHTFFCALFFLFSFFLATTILIYKKQQKQNVDL